MPSGLVEQPAINEYVSCEERLRGYGGSDFCQDAVFIGRLSQLVQGVAVLLPQMPERLLFEDGGNRAGGDGGVVAPSGSDASYCIPELEPDSGALRKIQEDVGRGEACYQEEDYERPAGERPEDGMNWRQDSLNYLNHFFGHSFPLASSGVVRMPSLSQYS